MITKLLAHTAVSVAAVLVGLGSPAFAEVTFEWVAVGDPGNAADSLNEGDIPGIGSVAYTYRIAKHEVINEQYAEFLNAVATTDPNGLYDTNMGADPRGGITRSGESGTFAYTVKAHMGNKPVNYVSFFDAMRLVNWMHNGQPTGAQDERTTEDGVYTITDGLSEIRAVDATFYIPTENEWYKAAYYDPRKQAACGPPGDDHYWLYPTQSDTAPTIASASAVGDIEDLRTNVANYGLGADWNGQDGNVMTVDLAGPGSASFYGTSDQGGNVYEWNEALCGSNRYLRGGTWDAVGYQYSAEAGIVAQGSFLAPSSPYGYLHILAAST